MMGTTEEGEPEGGPPWEQGSQGGWARGQQVVCAGLHGQLLQRVVWAEEQGQACSCSWSPLLHPPLSSTTFPCTHTPTHLVPLYSSSWPSVPVAPHDSSGSEAGLSSGGIAARQDSPPHPHFPSLPPLIK